MNTIRNAAENEYKPTSNQNSSQEPLFSTTSVQMLPTSQDRDNLLDTPLSTAIAVSTSS